MGVDKLKENCLSQNSSTDLKKTENGIIVGRDINPSDELNQIIKQNNHCILEMLSNRGLAIFFPKSGILSQTAEAKGKKINATIGLAVEEDNTPMRLNSIAKNINLNPKDIFPYAPSFGKPELRGIWQKMMREKNLLLGNKIISMPVVTNALTHGLSLCGYMFLNPGDSIIIPEPYWGNYKLIFVNGYNAKINAFDTFKNNGFNIDALKEKLMAEGEKKVLILNFPNNPTGYTPTEEEVTDIVRIIKKATDSGKKIVVILDDAYFGLVYKEGFYKESIFSQLADLHEKVLAVKLDGATKEDYVWGLRVGFITYASKGIKKETCEALEAKTAGAIRGNISNVPHISQSLVLNAFTSPTYKKEKAEKYNILKERFEKVVETLKSHQEYEKYFIPFPFNSGYFMCIRLSKGLDGEKIRKVLLEKYDTGIIAMKNILRITFSSVRKDLIPELFDNIYKACKE